LCQKALKDNQFLPKTRSSVHILAGKLLFLHRPVEKHRLGVAPQNYPLRFKLLVYSVRITFKLYCTQTSRHVCSRWQLNSDMLRFYRDLLLQWAVDRDSLVFIKLSIPTVNNVIFFTFLFYYTPISLVVFVHNTKDYYCIKKSCNINI
jgi:hypothetical protein